ncbi:MAG: glycosyltransferase [Deltaproteobacteria bacterium]|nr:glycosyltransferase [Deltaproteobacteria bacterium]
MAKQYREWGLHHIHVVQNGVDLQQFAPRPKNQALQQAHAIGRDAIVVAHVSNMKHLKRGLDIVDSAELALRQDSRLVYLIVGDGPLRQAMESACQEKGIANHFRFVGWVAHDEVPDYLNLADIVVMPSESEALALVYLETMACGRVLLASDVAGAREVIVDGQNGLLFRKGDITALTTQTLAAASDSVARVTIGDTAREMVHAYALPKLVDAYVSIIQEVIERCSHSNRPDGPCAQIGS